MSGRVFLLESSTGTITAMASPLLLAAPAETAEYYEIAKAVSQASKGSKRLREKYGTTLDGVMCATRPFDLYLYAYATTLNTYHQRAVRAKAKDIVGRPWSIVGEGSPAAKQRVADFFRGAFGRMTLGEGLGNVWTDYEALGNGYLEVIPNAKGEPAELAHCPATEMWIRLDGLGYVQQHNGEYAHFRAFGLEDAAFAELPANDPLSSENVTSMIHFSHYMPWSLYYGIPSIMPAWSAIALMVLVSEFNLTFFGNNAIPDYAVILEGEWEDNAEKTIEEYFRRHLKGQAHKTLCLQTPQGGKITFEKLTSDNAKEGSFRLLRQDSRDEILHAHGVPPQKVGLVESGKLGGNLASEQIVEYKNSIVTPGQEKVEARLNQIIETGFKVPDLKFRFEEYDIENDQINAQVDNTYINDGVLTPNEVRAERFPGREPLEGGDEPRRMPSMGDLAGVDEGLQQVQRQIREAIAK